MKQIFENMLITILLIISILVHFSMINANLEISEARNFHAEVVEILQASDFTQTLKDIQNANAEIFQKHPHWKLSFEDKTIYNDRRSVKVILKYKISPLPLINDNNYRTIVGYAR